MFLNKNTLKNVEIRNILDLSVDMDNIIDTVTKKWEYDIISNKSNNIDMVSFLYSSLNRNVIIVIPKNESIHSLQENRHGRLVGAQGNNKTFSFSIKIIDMNVISGDKLGEIRCFRLTDPEGNLYKGLDKLQVVAPNNKFVEEKINNGDIKFDYFIDPRRWIEFYSEEYFITKYLIKRLKLESSYYYKCIKRILDEGIKHPTEKKSNWPKIEQKREKKLIKLFEVSMLDIDFIGDFPNYTSNQNNLVYLTEKRNKFIYSIVPKLTFITRAIEFAFFKVNQESIPEEIKKEIGEVEWKTEKIKRTEWSELNFGDFTIMKRIYEKMEIM